MSECCVNAIHTVGRIIISVHKDTKFPVHCDVGLQHNSDIASLIHHVHIWVKVHTSNWKQGEEDQGGE